MTEHWERPTEKLVKVLGAGIENSPAVPNVLAAAVSVHYLEQRTVEAGLSWEREEAGEAVSQVGRAFARALVAQYLRWQWEADPQEELSPEAKSEMEQMMQTVGGLLLWTVIEVSPYWAGIIVPSAKVMFEQARKRGHL